MINYVSLYVLLLLGCCTFITAQYVETGSDLHMDSDSAYCYYYQTSNAYITNTDTYMNATSDNLYAYATVYASTDLGITSSSVLLSKCTPHSSVNDTCGTNTDSTFTYISYDTQYILVCLECHYWLGDCIIDNYTAYLTISPSYGYVSCSTCH